VPFPTSHPRDPLHGITLETIVKFLVDRHGWAELGWRIPIRCFLFNPTVKSSLIFLRKTPWARQKVEAWYLAEVQAPPALPGSSCSDEVRGRPTPVDPDPKPITDQHVTR